MDDQSKERLLDNDNRPSSDSTIDIVNGQNPLNLSIWARLRSPVVLLSIALLISIGVNIFGLINYLHSRRNPLTAENVPSRYAGLIRELSIPYQWGTEYGLYSKNETSLDELWEEIDIDDGIVAIPDNVVEELGLPRSDRFPWDDQKGLYVMTAHHDLHCLKYIHRFVYESHHSLPLTRGYKHVTHCLDNLRVTLQCSVDDTPQPIDLSGTNIVGALHQCRSWDKYISWTKKYSACYSQITDKIHQKFEQIERYKFCANGSPYLPAIRAHFGLPEDWDGERGKKDLMEKGLKELGLEGR